MYKIKLLNLHIIRGAQTGNQSLAQRRKIARMCALYKAYTGERAWKAIGDRLSFMYITCKKITVNLKLIILPDVD
jgi:hypothetical protein